MRCLAPLVLSLLVACLPHPADRVVRDTLPGGIAHVRSLRPLDTPDTVPVALTEVARIQPPEGSPGELGDIQEIAVDDSGGIYVVEAGPLRIDHYGPTGEFLGSVGRQGAGPGEYQSASIGWVGGALVVHDFQLARTSVFDRTGRHLRTWTSSCCIGQSIRGDLPGRVYIPILQASGLAAGERSGWTRYKEDGTLLDTLWRRTDTREFKFWNYKSPRGEANVSVPYQPGLFDTPWRTGGILTGDNGSYRFTVSSNGIDTLLVIDRAWTPPMIPEGMRRAEFESFTKENARLRAVARFEDLPMTGPAFDDIAIDGAGELWVRRILYDGSARTVWDLFAADGAWLAVVTVPGTYQALGFHLTDPILVTTDAQDRPVIVRYHLTPDLSR